MELFRKVRSGLENRLDPAYSLLLRDHLNAVPPGSLWHVQTLQIRIDLLRRAVGQQIQCHEAVNRPIVQFELVAVLAEKQLTW
jgi:hypothetical protein